MRLVILPLAREDLFQIAEYIALDSPARAASFVRELEEVIVRDIPACPASFRARDDLSPGVRMAVRAPYLIFFRVLADRIEIVRVLHGAQDLTSQLKR